MRMPSTSELVVRAADASEVDAIRAIDGLGGSTRALLERDLADADHVVLVAERDGRVVGAALGMLLLDQLHVTDIAVTPACRGTGLGSRLLAALVDAGVSMGATSATLEVRPTNHAARALYASAGFVEEGRRPGYYPASDSRPAEDALILWRHDLAATTPTSDGVA